MNKVLNSLTFLRYLIKYLSHFFNKKIDTCKVLVGNIPQRKQANVVWVTRRMCRLPTDTCRKPAWQRDKGHM